MSSDGQAYSLAGKKDDWVEDEEELPPEAKGGGRGRGKILLVEWLITELGWCQRRLVSVDAKKRNHVNHVNLEVP